ncbi:hypothetical protein FQN54_001360 [Arachnomyces sp. PD_36]|nr:hypothetical protein FQN54_001360 [Arachnomyces sp. PD_36]
MPPTAGKVNGDVGYSPGLNLPDFGAAPDKFGWPRKNEHGYEILEQPCGIESNIRVIHIGAGISGICFSKFLSEALNNISFVCYDRNADIGGTWLENRYPGCACDIPSVNYQFSFARNPDWSHFYSYSEEIWDYLRDVTDRFDLRKHMKLSHEVVGATWDEEKGVWQVLVKDLVRGITFLDTAEVLINGMGVLNKWKWPVIEGLHDFKGILCHTARYDPQTELEGRRVAVIGTGSSGIQVTATIASQVSKLYTWIRSPTWVTAGFAQSHAGPNGENFAYTAEQKKAFRENPLEYLNYSKEIENELNQRFKFILNGTPEALGAREFSTKQMKEKLNNRQDLIDRLIPTTFGIGCRRPTPGNGFLEALTLPNVQTFAEEMRRITPRGFIDHEGTEHEVDVIICATGFDTTWVPSFPIVAHGKNVQDTLREKPLSYLSIGLPDIPNYWMGIGPYGPLGHGSFVPIVELVYSNIITVLKRMQKENIKSLTPRREVCDAFAEHANLFLKRTAWASKCRSWFKQGREDGPLAMFPGSRLVFFDLLSTPRYEDYKIVYSRDGNPFNFLGNGFSIKEYDGSDLSYYLGTEAGPGAQLPRQSAADKAENEMTGNQD